GFVLRDGYRTDLTGLDRPEAQSLFLAGAPLAAAQLGLGDAVGSLRLKLAAAMPAQARLDAERVARCFHLDPVAWYQAPDQQQRLPELASAVWARRWLHLQYAGWSAVVERRVAPLGLVLKGGLWYLVAAHEGKTRTYRVSNIQSLQVLDEFVQEADLPAGFDLQRYWAEFTADFEARMQQGHAQLRVRTRALPRLAQLNHAVAQAVARAGPADRNGWHAVQIPIESTSAATGDLLRLGPDVQAMAPPALRQAVRRAATAMLRAHGGLTAPKKS
ncbi:MAG: transcriptional regulator, partial [Burkholderiales bacterium PBB5]